jgi:hypothetical protein
MPRYRDTADDFACQDVPTHFRELFPIEAVAYSGRRPERCWMRGGAQPGPAMSGFGGQVKKASTAYWSCS